MANGNDTVLAAVRAQMPDNSINIQDNRDTDATSGKPVQKNSSFSGKYDPQIIKDIVAVAKQKGIDPNTFLAMGLQETSFGKNSFRPGMNENYLGVPESQMNVMASDDIDWEKLDSDQYRDANFKGKSVSEIRQHILGLQADFFKQKMQIADSKGFTDEAQRLQAWNGYGKIKSSMDGKNDVWGGTQYGVDIPPQGIDSKVNPLYGKRIIDLRDNVIKSNPQIQKIVSNQPPSNIVPKEIYMRPENYTYGNDMDDGESDAIKNTAPDRAAVDNTRVAPKMSMQLQNQIIAAKMAMSK